MLKLRSVEDFQLRNSFDNVCRGLRDDRLVGHLDKPLAYWALPKDRRLPLALMGRSLRSVLETPFEELSATPGVGQKKIASLVKLLHRAARSTSPPPILPPPLADEIFDDMPAREAADQAADFDPNAVSELMWNQWCDTVRRHSLESEKLGRIAASLLEMPTVIWHTPLSHYMQQSIREIRQAKTYGEKRVRLVLEVFFRIHEMLGDTVSQEGLAVRLMPTAIARADNWISQTLCRAAVTDERELRAELLQPLLDQLRIDGGEELHRLSCERLGQGQPRLSVRVQAAERNVTRARIYQLFEFCAKIMKVRWPAGRCQLELLAEKMEAASPAARELLDDTRKLFFPMISP